MDEETRDQGSGASGRSGVRSRQGLRSPTGTLPAIEEQRVADSSREMGAAGTVAPVAEAAPVGGTDAGPTGS